MRQVLLTIVCALMFHSVGAQKPQLVVPTGHTGQIKSIVFSQDETIMVSASEDHTARVWDISSGKLIASLRDDSSAIIYACLTRDGKKVITGTTDNLRIWDIATQACLYKFNVDKIHADEAFLADQKDYWKMISTKGRLSVSLNTGDFTLTPLDTISNKKYQENILQDPTREIDRVSLFMDSLVRNEIGNLKDTTFKNYIEIRISPDNLKFVIYDRLHANVKVFDLSDHRYHELKDIDSLSYHDQWDMTANFVSFSKNGKFLAVTKSYDPDLGDNFNTKPAIIQVWDLEHYTMLTELPAHLYAVDLVTFNENNTRLISAGRDYQMKLWDLTNLNSKKPLQVFKGHSAISGFAISPIKNEVLIRLDNKTARLWDITTGKCIPFESQNIGKLHYDKDGKYFWELSANGLELTLYRSDTKELIRALSFEERVLSAKMMGYSFIINTGSSISKIDLSHKPFIEKKLASCGKEDQFTSVVLTSSYLVTASRKKSVTIKNLHTGLVTKIPFVEEFLTEIDLKVNEKASRLLVTFENQWGDANPMYILYDMTGKKIAQIESPVELLHVDGTKSVDFSHNGKFLSSTSATGELVTLWDAETGKVIYNWNMSKEYSYDAYMYTPVFSKDDSLLICSSYNGHIRIWNTRTGEQVTDVKAEEGETYSGVGLSYDNKYLISATDEGLLRLWDFASMKQLYSLVPLDEKDYLFIDKDANYDGSEGARKLLYLVCGTEIIDLDQFKEIGWQPGLAAKIIGFDKEPLQENNLSKLSVCNVSPLVKSQGLQNGSYQFQIQERNGGLGVVQVFVNGKQVKTYSTDSLTKMDNSVYQFSIKQEEVNRYFLTGTDNQNHIQVKVTTRDHSMTSRGGEGEGPVLTEKKANPNIYIIAIGVNDYKGPQLHLKYAASDAVGFASALTPAAQKLLNTDTAEHVKTYVFTTNRENADKPYKKAIKDRLEKIAAEAKANDILLVFFAGHGVLFGDKKTFYLLTAEASAFDLSGVENEVAISYKELSEWMRNIAANKQVLIMDACNSGAVVPGARGIPADLARAQENLKDQTGTNLLAASASGMSAYEATEFGQGYLTYGLLSAIKNQDGLTEHKFIDIATWFSAAVKKVTELAQETGKRQDPKINVEATFALGMVDTALLNRIKLPRRKEVFARSVMVSLPGMTDQLHLSIKQDSVLNIMSAMGKESPLTFIESNTTMEAYSIRGNYEIQNNKLIIRVSLIYGEKPVYQFVKLGSVNLVNNLSLAITEDIIAYLKKRIKTDNGVTVKLKN